MFVKIDHLAISSRSLEIDLMVFQKLGYQISYEGKGLENLEIKRNYLRLFSAFHDLVLLEKKSSFPVEILKHEGCFKNLPWMTPLLETNDLNDFTFKKALLRCASLETSKKFWSLFGMKAKELVGETNVMTWQAPFFQQNFEFVLYEDKIQRDLYLDDEIINCVAFFSSSLVRDRELLMSKGLQVTPIQSLELSKKLNIFFVKGPQSENVEVIGL